MGRQVRRVPADWQHPIDPETGHFKPLFDSAKFAAHSRDYMPAWPDAERTHFMMYENTSEGTPISPAFETPEELARWLADTNASAFGNSGASYEAWLNIARGEWAPSMIYTPQGGLQSGVEASTLLQAPLASDTD